MTPNAEMTTRDLVAYLRQPATRLLDLARSGSLPAEKVRNQWRFRREEIDRWLEASHVDIHSLEECAHTEAAVGCIESNDIEEYEAFMAPWDIEFDQLSKGQFHARVQYTRLPGILVYEANWRLAARTRGTAPNGYVMFGASLSWRRARNYWCGHELDQRHFACVGPNEEFGHTSPDGSHHAVILVDRELLADAVGEATVDGVCGWNHAEFTAVDGARIAAAMTELLSLTKQYPYLLNDPREVARARSWLLEPFVGCLEASDKDDSRETATLRKVSVHWAIDLVDRSSLPMSALELAKMVGVSQRTLEHGFRELLGVTPASYLRLHRMNRAKHDLAHADPTSTTVLEIALKWGFSHPGRFSSVYQSLFGEMPSQTLNKKKTGPLHLS